MLKLTNAFASCCVMVAGTWLLEGCGEDDDRPSDVHTLRVLAVRSESPFVKPGTSTTLSVLAFDGSPRAKLADGGQRRNTTLWLGGCVNPPGDSYLACMPYLHEVVAGLGDQALQGETLPEGTPPGVVGWDDTFSLEIPADIISARPLAKTVVYPYGVEMVFFARCGGVLRRATDNIKEFPLGCFDRDSGERLGRDDFEFGFYPVFAYETLENQNPVIQALRFQGSDSGAPCSDTTPCADGSHCGTSGNCIPSVARCTRTDKDDCESYEFAVDVVPSIVEPATVAHIPAADAPAETIWVSYYGNAGSFEQDARIINEAHSGWNNETAGRWRAKTDSPREVRLWAVVRDNRNGVAWSWRDVWVE